MFTIYVFVYNLCLQFILCNFIDFTQHMPTTESTSTQTYTLLVQKLLLPKSPVPESEIPLPLPELQELPEPEIPLPELQGLPEPEIPLPELQEPEISL
jgi:hypothetical protein